MWNLKRKINSSSRLVGLVSVVAIGFSLTACGGGTTGDNDGTTTGTGDETRWVAAFDGNVALNGAGASFPAPLFQNWFVSLNREISELQVNYQSVGSGAGIEQFTAQTVDFGASDVAMTDEQIDKVARGVLLLPVTAGAIALSYNIPGVDTGLKLSRDVYVDILMGDITRWNDPRITELNPDIELPDMGITVVHRADGSGTTGFLTKHLSAISDKWENAIGAGTAVEWPTTKGTFIGGRGNEGVTAGIQQNEGAIGYIEYGYAKQNNIPMAALENLSGNFIVPTDESAAATLAAVELPDNLRAFITDPEGAESYPIVTYSWILAFQEYDDPQKAIAMEQMIQYALTDGQKVSSELGYVPLPREVVERVAAVADTISPDHTIEIE